MSSPLRNQHHCHLTLFATCATFYLIFSRNIKNSTTTSKERVTMFSPTETLLLFFLFVLTVNVSSLRTTNNHLAFTRFTQNHCLTNNDPNHPPAIYSHTKQRAELPGCVPFFVIGWQCRKIVVCNLTLCEPFFPPPHTKYAFNAFGAKVFEAKPGASTLLLADG